MTVIGYSHLYSKFSTSDHYEVKRGSLVWFILLKNTSLSEIPVVKPNNTPKYSYSIDSPHIEYFLDMNYESKMEINEVVSTVITKLAQNEFEIYSGRANCGEWAWRNNNDLNKIEYNGRSSKGECLYLEFKEIGNIVKINAGIAR